MKRPHSSLLLRAVPCVAVGILIGMWWRERSPQTQIEAKEPSKSKSAAHLAADSRAAYDPGWDKPYPQYQPVGKVLKPCPVLKPGEICPQDLSVYGGAGRTSLASVDDVADFDEFYRMCAENKPAVMTARKKYMAQRYSFTGEVCAEVTMTRGKPLPLGPVVRLPKEIPSWEQLGELCFEEIARRN